MFIQKYGLLWRLKAGQTYGQVHKIEQKKAYKGKNGLLKMVEIYDKLGFYHVKIFFGQYLTSLSISDAMKLL
jgi:hypothetical protein